MIRGLKRAKLPTEYPLPEALSIYIKRIGALLLVIGISALVLATFRQFGCFVIPAIAGITLLLARPWLRRSLYERDESEITAPLPSAQEQSALLDRMITFLSIVGGITLFFLVLAFFGLLYFVFQHQFFDVLIIPIAVSVTFAILLIIGRSTRSISAKPLPPAELSGKDSAIPSELKRRERD